MTFNEAYPLILGGIKGWASIKGINLEQNKTEEEWSVFIEIALHHILREDENGTSNNACI